MHSAVDDATRALITDTVLAAGRYFEVLIVDVDFAPRGAAVGVTIAVWCAEFGDRAGSFEVTPDTAWNQTHQIIRAIVGDWTLHL
jgi:hypothetical protein